MRKPFITKDGATRVTYRMDGVRRTIHLGTGVNLAFAYDVQQSLDELARYCERRESVSDDLWFKISRYPIRVRESMRRQGLFEFMKMTVLTIGEFVDEHKKLDTTKEMRRHHDDAFRHLLEYFPAETQVNDLCEHQLESFGYWLENKRERRLKAKTVHNTFKMLRTAFKNMKKKGFVTINPFEDVKAGSSDGDPSEYIERDTVLKTLEACSHPEVRMAVVFARFAGLRIPGEIENLKWEHVVKATFFVTGKTGTRTVPLFKRVADELKNYDRGDEYLFPEARKRCDSWVGGKYITALRRSGVDRWEKLMNSLRASCITDYEHEGIHEKTLNAIFGNSKRVRMKHYIKVRNIDYEKVLALDFDKKVSGNLPSKEFIERLSPLLSIADIVTLWHVARAN